MHAPFVEEVRNGNAGVSSVRVSEWNWGRMTDQRCLVTENFGKPNERWVSVDSIAQVWRPGLPLNAQ